MLKEDIQLELSIILGWSKNVFNDAKPIKSNIIDLYLDTKLTKKDEIEIQHAQEAQLVQPEYIRDNNTLFNILESIEIKPVISSKIRESSKFFDIIGNNQDKVVTYSIEYSDDYILKFKEFSSFVMNDKTKVAQTSFKKNYERQNKRQENQLKHQKYLDKQTRLRNEKKQKQAIEKQIEVEVKSQKILNSQKKQPTAPVTTDSTQVDANIESYSANPNQTQQNKNKDGYSKYNQKNKYQPQSSYAGPTKNNDYYGKNSDNYEYKGQKEYSNNYYSNAASSTGYKGKGKYEDIDNYYMEPSQAIGGAGGGNYQQKQSGGGYNNKKKKR